jgi:hypothetical protein
MFVEDENVELMVEEQFENLELQEFKALDYKNILNARLFNYKQL